MNPSVEFHYDFNFLCQPNKSLSLFLFLLSFSDLTNCSRWNWSSFSVVSISFIIIIEIILLHFDDFFSLKKLIHSTPLPSLQYKNNHERHHIDTQLHFLVYSGIRLLSADFSMQCLILIFGNCFTILFFIINIFLNHYYHYTPPPSFLVLIRTSFAFIFWYTLYI